jgi:hypothetical protein
VPRRGQLHDLGNHEAMNLPGVRGWAARGLCREEPAGVGEKERTEWIARNGADSGAGSTMATFAGRTMAVAPGHHDRRNALLYGG